MKHGLDLRRRCFVSGAIVIALTPAACAGEPAPGPELAPPGAQPLQARGAFELALSNCEAVIASQLRPGHGRLSFARYLLDNSASRDAVTAFYTGRLGPGWSPLGGYPQQQLGFHLHLWQRRDWLGSEPVLGAAWLDDLLPDAAGQPMRLLVVVASRHG